MIQDFPYKNLPWYPHMGQQDAAIWSRFLDKFPDLFDKVWYDLPIGETGNVSKELPRNIQTDGDFLLRYKCDVVAFKDGKPTIIEIKPRAGLACIGQIIGYDLLYQEYIDREARPDLVIVTDALRPDIDWLCAEFGIKIEIV